MTRLMFDAVSAANIPAGAQLVAGYVDGANSQWSDADWARFPNATLVRICTNPEHDDGVVLDVEQGDATPADAPAWLTMRRAAGIDPTVYCSSSMIPDVAQACQAAGVAEPHYWAANWDGDPTIPVGAVAKQYMSTPALDFSEVADFWPGVDSQAQALSQAEFAFATELVLYPDVANPQHQPVVTNNSVAYAWATPIWKNGERTYTLTLKP